MSITFNMLRTFQDVIRGISVIGDEIGDMNSSTCDTEITIVGFLSIMIFTTVGDSSQVTDTCGHYFFLPMFPACELFLEVIPCFNDTPNVIVTMSTPAGDVVHSFLVVFGATTELPLHSINKPKYEGLIVRSNEDISVYLHNTSGDSMIIFPIDALARDYEIPRLASYKDFREKSSRNSAKNYHDGALYIFSPFNNTSITIAQLYDARESTSPFSSSHSSSIYSSPFSTTTVKLDAFEIYEYHIDTFRRYRLHSADVFAIILIQTSNKFYDNGSLCGEARLSLIDFVPPYSVRGKYFYLAFPKVTEFRLFVTGLENTSLDLTTDTVSRELFLDHSGNFMTVVSRTSSAWITASQPVSIYIKMTLCSNASSPSAKMCAENGFFLPSVEHYFTCDGNLSKGVCLCTCPSFFQRETNPSNFHILRNSSKARPTTIYPLLVGELFDVTTSIIESIEYKDSDDVIVTTNTTFLIFRFDLDNLNFLPAGTTLGNVYKVCVPNMYTVLFHACEDIEPSEETKHRQLAMNPPDSNQCSCEFFQDAVLFPVANGDSNNKYNLAGSSGGKSRPSGGGGNDFVWVEEDDDTARPLIAVVVSLCVSIFAVIALISGYMLVEMTTRRKHVRNTKIRPFVS